jgi:hypothetical protein
MPETAILTPSHESQRYAMMIARFLQHKEQKAYWRTFLRLAEEFQLGDLDIDRSSALRKRHDMAPRRCYYNAAMLAMEMPAVFDYMEGVATSVIPTEHAWVVDRSWNRVVDPTWIKGHQSARSMKYKIKDYYGIRIPLEIVRREIRETEIAGPMLWRVMEELKTVKRRRRFVE